MHRQAEHPNLCLCFRRRETPSPCARSPAHRRRFTLPPWPNDLSQRSASCTRAALRIMHEGSAPHHARGRPSHIVNRRSNNEHFTAYNIIPKTIGNRKRDCAWAWGVNTTWENLQIEKHKSVRRAERTPSWFVLFDLQIFSGGVYSPSATSRAISFSISNSFWYYVVCSKVLIVWTSIDDVGFIFSIFSTIKKNGAAGNSIVCFAASIACQSRHVTVRRMRTVSKSATFLATESVNSAPFRRGKTEVQIFWQGKAQNSSPIKVHIFGKEKCKTHRQF